MTEGGKRRLDDERSHIERMIEKGEVRPVYRHYRHCPPADHMFAAHKSLSHTNLSAMLEETHEQVGNLLEEMCDGLGVEEFQGHRIAWYPADKEKRWFQPGPRGGATTCYLYLNNGVKPAQLIGCGESECSMKDPFEYAMGRAIALERAIYEVAQGSE